MILNNTQLLLRAVIQAEQWHRGVPRKYTGEPYITHTLEAATILASLDFPAFVCAAAILHDVREDCGIQDHQLAKMFGSDVAKLVDEVTDRYTKKAFPEMNRKLRKAKEVERIATISYQGKCIKLADMCSNSKDIMQHDPGFAKEYMPEKKAVLNVCTDAHPALIARARGFIEQWELSQESQK